jgi:hypothetical protein
MDAYSRLERMITDTDVCFTFVEHVNEFSLYNKSELQNLIQLMKLLATDKQISVMKENNHTVKIKGITYYILVVNSDSENMSKAGLLLFDNFSLMVDGTIWIFRNKTNRDNIFNYIKKIQEKC